MHCAEHGVSTICPSWSRARSRFTLQFESYLIDVLQTTQVNAASAQLMRVGEKRLRRIKRQAVARGLQRRRCANAQGFCVVRHVCVDEKSLFKGHHYVTILYNGQDGEVLEVVEHRDEEAARSAFSQLGDYIDLNGVQVVTMDMWKAFRSATRCVIPQATVVHDRFHLVKYLNNAVDITRRSENKRLRKTGDDLLKSTKYLWLKHPDRLSPVQKIKHEQLLQREDLQTTQVWKLKEDFRNFFNACSVQNARTFFAEWYKRVESSSNKHMSSVANTFKRHLDDIVTYVQYPVSNAMAEGVNSSIQQLKCKARGFSSAENYRNNILFHLGGLDLYP